MGDWVCFIPFFSFFVGSHAHIFADGISLLEYFVHDLKVFSNTAGDICFREP